MDIENEFDVLYVQECPDIENVRKLDTPIPSTISCKVLRLLPSQIIVTFKWNQSIYADALLRKW